MNFEIDAGNSRIKWRVNSAGIILDRGSFTAVDIDSELEQLRRNHARVDRVLISSVRPSLKQELQQQCLKLWSVEPEFATVSRQFGQLVNAYKDVGEMGVDRWLAMVGARLSYSGALLVVSAGTALTVDLVASCGQHLGGFIAPGMEMMRSSLFGGTDQVKLDAVIADPQLPTGRTTGQAVSSALGLMQFSLINTALQRLCGQESDKEAMLVLSGGAARLLAALLEAQLPAAARHKITVDQDLVFTGLSAVSDYSLSSH